LLTDARGVVAAFSYCSTTTRKYRRQYARNSEMEQDRMHSPIIDVEVIVPERHPAILAHTISH
jgi:hypothetical protein